jgi:formate hydrogenlyase subunit 3/multisubunit Na+/H+ antiporter MnhD subunit
MPSSSSTLGGFDQQSFGVIALLIVALVVVFCTWQSCQAWRRRREMYHLQVCF